VAAASLNGIGHQWKIRFFWYVPAFLSAGVAATYLSHRTDRYILRETSLDIVRAEAEPSDRVLALSHWVHAHLPTDRNRQSFLISGLRATPMQVLERGGDCADKSRLLSAMLREIGIRATMAMCFDPETDQPSHTVVEARTGPSSYMVVDPAFELYFPKPEGGYYGLLEMRARPEILTERLNHLRSVRTWPDLSFFYPEQRAVYDKASTVNWDRNWSSRCARAILKPWYGDELHHVSRPVLSEEPKLFVLTVLLMLGGIYAAAAWCCYRRVRPEFMGTAAASTWCGRLNFLTESPNRGS
jgi:hypothetical protein